jgi:hypothetical protein
MAAGAFVAAHEAGDESVTAGTLWSLRALITGGTFFTFATDEQQSGRKGEGNEEREKELSALHSRTFLLDAGVRPAKAKREVVRDCG